eukprot:TRINITY_DN5302_c0_g1_i1.p1 TRINITY_DN5302_c0_g1~~TRINITY_DN5302_c0_g1_i1.p1  ORF type:complete len:307 (-),score=38.31 TRINITY_DN5302_c0_g1_i1:189-1109(-)
MADVSVIAALKEKLDKHIESADATEILKDLQEFSKYDITKEILASTMVGRSVWKLRKHAEAEIAKLSAVLTDGWKAKAQGLPAAPAAASVKQEAVKTDGTPSQEEKEKSRKRQREEDKAAKSEGSVSKTPKPEANGTSDSKPGDGDPVREKVVELLTQALGERTAEALDDPAAVAAEIELELYKLYRGVTADYRSKHRSLSFNLKNPKNPELRQSVMNGVIDPARLVTMSSEDMASKELQEKRRKMLEYQTEAAKVGAGGGTQSDMFTCSKCGSNQTTYYQMQTRSSDEPMTTFHTCMKCGKRWKS